MNKDKNKKNYPYIEGIFNYCDRWCERCAFTSNCLNFAMGEELENKIKKDNLNVNDFWDVLEDLLDTTIELLHEKADEFDINLDNEIEDEDFHEESRIKRLINESTDCAVASNKYIALVSEWFDNPVNKTSEFEKLDSEVSKKNIPFKIIDSIEVIRWYQYQIYVKTMRAISGKEEDEFEDMPKDSDGSAKVALIGIDRSISAWGNLLMNFADDDNSIFSILLHLVDLQHLVETKFPNARAFVRPGFDN